MSRFSLIRPLACAALLAAAGAPLAAQDVVEAGRRAGIAPSPEMVDRLRQDSTAFEFRRAWRHRTRQVRQQRAALERREGPRLSVSQLVQAEAAVTGTLRIPVLLGLYAGATAPYAQSEYQTRLFGPQLYSARSFYQEMSRGVFSMDGTVSPWAALPENAAYYQPVNVAGRFGRTREYLKHTLDATDAQMDFAQFDNDGPDGVPNSGDDDGYVDAAAFVYPAEDMACGGPGIWAHRWTYAAWWGTPYVTQDARAGGGFIRVDDYLIQGGIDCDGTSLMQIGTFSHEMGHALGLPDLYDTYGDDGNSAGVGEWDLMGSGNYRRQDAPAHMGAWSKDFLGWVNVETVSATRTSYTLPRVYENGTVLRYDVPGTREYFLMEHRGPTGSDRNIHGTGLLVFHVDPAVIDTTTGQNRVNAHARMGVGVEEADGRGDLLVERNRGDGGDVFPGTTGRTAFGDTGTPNTRSNGGAPSGLELRNIALSGGQLGFDFVVNAMLSGPGLVTLRSRGDTTATSSVALGLTNGTGVGFRARAQRAWLAVTPDTGAAPASLTLTARPQGLASGIYHDTVLVTSSAVGNSPLRIPVQYVVQPGLVQLGDSVSGHISVAGRRDTLFVQMTAGDTVDFAVFDAAVAPFAPTLTLVAPSGAQQALPVATAGGMAGIRRARLALARPMFETGTYRLIVGSTSGTGGYVVKVRHAGPVPMLEPASRVYLPVAANAVSGSDTIWIYNAGRHASMFTVSAAGVPWLSVTNGTGEFPGRGGAPAAGSPSVAASSAPLGAPGTRTPAAEAGEATDGPVGGSGPQAAHAGSMPVVLTATRGGLTQGDHVGYAVARLGDDWAGPAVVEVRMRVYEPEVVLLTPQKMYSRPVALAVAPEGDLGVVLVNGDIVRMDPNTGAIRPWGRTTTSAWWGMAFAADSSAYIAEFQRVARVARDGTVSTALSVPGSTVYDVVVTPAGQVFAATDVGLWRVMPTGVATRLTTEFTYGVAYNPGDGLIYASINGAQIRRVNPTTGAITSITASDASVQQQLEIGADGVIYARTNYLNYPDLRRMSPTGQLDRGWWTPQPFPQAMALGPDGTMYGTAGDRVFRVRVERAPPPTHAAGDVTGDGAITAQDALGVLSAAVGKTLPAGWTAAWGDANCDAQVTAQDALIILSHAVGKDVTQFCVGQPQP